MINEHQPEIIFPVNDPEIGMTGFVVIDDTTAGPGKGGMRMTSNLTVEEVARLARTMTWKNAVFMLPFGGAKSGIVWPGGDRELKEKYVRSFARKIKELIPGKYIAGPDVNSGETEMTWIADEVGLWSATTGKPADYCEKDILGQHCGLPHELGSTGYGVAMATVLTSELLKLEPKKTTVGIHGFGNVGTFAAKHLIKAGFIVTLAADSDTVLYRENGLTENEVDEVIARVKSLKDLEGTKLSHEEFWKTKVDILIPASVTNVINETNKDDINCKLMVQGGNIVMIEEIERELHERGIVIVPDFVANGGGIISSYTEIRGLAPEEMFAIVKEKITKATLSVMTESLSSKKYPREVALKVAQENLKKLKAQKGNLK